MQYLIANLQFAYVRIGLFFLQQKMSEGNIADRIIDNIVGYSQQHGNLLHKYNLEFFLAYFDRNAILALSECIPAHQQLTSQDFLRLFLLRIPHSPEETLFLALSLKQLFDCILERTSSSQSIEFSDFTTYLCQKISREDLDVVLSPKRIAKQRLEPDSQRIRGIDLEPVEIVRKVRIEVPKINKDMQRWNRKLDEKRGVAKFYYSSEQRKIVAMGTLSSSIFIYDEELKDKIQIKPNECKQLQKSSGILSMAYNGHSNRIGAILTNSTIIFWEGGDNFTTEKIIPNKGYGDRIHFLELNNQWVTVSKNSLYFWDLKEEAVTRTIAIPQSALINDICEMTHLRAVCVALLTLRDQKAILVFHKDKRVARICLDNAGCHSLHYNRLTQGLIPLGYHNIVQVYTVQGSLFDVELKYVLRGHRSIITCVDSQPNGSLMITGDDIGEIRIWELTRMRCIQSIKLTKWLGQLRLAGQKLFYSDSRINALQIDHFQVAEAENFSSLYQFYDDNQQAIWVITHKDARMIDASQGKMRRIYLLCDEDDDISAAVKIGDGFIVGTSKGQLYHYDSDCNLRWQKQAHQGEVRSLLFDPHNRLIFSLGAEGKISAWPERSAQSEEERKSITFRGRPINLLCLSSRSTMLIAGHNEECEVSLWDYEILKLYQLLEMQSPVTAVIISQTVDLIVVATCDGTISLIQFAKKEHMLDLQLISQLTLPKSAQTGQLEGPSTITSLQLMLLDNQKHILVAGLVTGHLCSIDISVLIATHFPAVSTAPFRESVNILRNQREDFDTSFSQHGFKRSIGSLKKSNFDQQSLHILWKAPASKQAIHCIVNMGIESGLLGVICNDYIKLIGSADGQTLASLNINHPLPVKWDLKMERKSLLKQGIYKILQILDNILKNSGYQMLAKQYRLINITEFMDNIRSHHFNSDGLSNPVQLLASEYQPQDIMGERRPEPSLKILEAYKRVKNIKKMSQQAMSLPVVTSEQNREALLDKDYVSQLLSPAHFTNLEKIEADHNQSILTARLSEALNVRQPRKMKGTMHEGAGRNFLARLSSKPNVLKDLVNSNSMINLSRSCFLRDDLKQRKDAWHKRNQEKDIKQILSDLNNKLRNCRKTHSRPLL